MNTTPVINQRRSGSPAAFEEQWLEAIRQGGGRWLIYPVERPATQFDLFEQVKAAEVDVVLNRYQFKRGLALEYGCGAAGMSIYLVNKGFQAVTCDLSFKALRLSRMNAARHLAEGSPESMHGVAANVFCLPFADRAFDVVMSYGLLEHFAPNILDAVLTEVIRTLRPGGLFIADIAHGRFSVRTLGVWLSSIGSTLFHTVTLRWRQLPDAYLEVLYENDLDERQWSAALQRAGLSDVNARILHPFPPLAMSGRMERLYVSLLKFARPMWRWFDRTQPSWGRKWGWLYLVWGIKCASL